jgi:hypothetical protein
MRVIESVDWKGELCKDLYSDLGQLKWDTALPLHDLGRSYLNVSPKQCRRVYYPQDVRIQLREAHEYDHYIRTHHFVVGREKRQSSFQMVR